MQWLSSDRNGLEVIEWPPGDVVHEEALIEELGTRAWVELRERKHGWR